MDIEPMILNFPIKIHFDYCVAHGFLIFRYTIALIKLGSQLIKVSMNLEEHS